MLTEPPLNPTSSKEKGLQVRGQVVGKGVREKAAWRAARAPPPASGSLWRD